MYTSPGVGLCVVGVTSADSLVDLWVVLVVVIVVVTLGFAVTGAAVLAVTGGRVHACLQSQLLQLMASAWKASETTKQQNNKTLLPIMLDDE